jgi:hypothetical protein
VAPIPGLRFETWGTRLFAGEVDEEGGAAGDVGLEEA